MGLIYYEMGKNDLAIFNFTKAISFNPQSFDAYNKLGLTYQ